MSHNGATGFCLDCGCAVQPDALGRHMRRRCGACKKVFERERLRASKRAALADPVKRTAMREYERRRVGGRKGRPVRSKEQIAADKQRRDEERKQQRESRAKRGWTERLKREAPEVYERYKDRKRNTLSWHARYHLDPAFKAKEIERVRRKKAQRHNMRSDGTLVGHVVRQLFAETRRCPCCKRAMASTDKSLDHIVPVSKGGQHSILNVRVICKACNTKKAARLPSQLTLGAA